MVNHRSSQEAGGEPPHQPAVRTDALEHIADSLRGLQFGQLTILVQDGVVVQIERTEKRRLR